MTNQYSEKAGFIVVMPAYCEPGITDVLDSLWNCIRPQQAVEVILVINAPENAPLEITDCNNLTATAAEKWITNHNDPGLRFFIMHKILPVKDAGVGLARKTGMDEANRRFNFAGNNKGYILSLDADSRVDSNYFTAIEEVVTVNPAIKGFDIYFEHPVEGDGFEAEVYSGIMEYELHLRYVNQFLRHTGFPYAHHTVGSCFGVRTDVYSAQGGMNKRKGGEDFYFLHKIIPLGNFTDINTTRVIPSPRESFRVPFGTGPAVTKRLAEGLEMETYSPDCFSALKQFFRIVPGFFRATPQQIQDKIISLPFPLKEFLTANEYAGALAEINANTGTVESFVNRFYRWFDAFRIVKFLNFASRDYYPKIRITQAASALLKLMAYNVPDDADAKSLLEFYRAIERDF